MFQEIKTYVLGQKEILKNKIACFKIKPTFVVVQVGNVEASNRYVRNKIKDCLEVGIDAKVLHLDDDITEEDLLSKMTELNNDDSLDAYMVQFPLPKHIDQKVIQLYITKSKDADGFINNGITNPATPQGIVSFLERQNYDFEDKNALVIGRSEIVGKPMVRLLLEKNCNVTVVHSHTSFMNRNWYLNNADLIICATGKVNLIARSDFWRVSPPNYDKVVFDIGINFDENGKLVGDCEKSLPVGWQSPVPGGVGLLTRLQLLENIVKLYELRHEEEF